MAMMRIVMFMFFRIDTTTRWIGVLRGSCGGHGNKLCSRKRPEHGAMRTGKIEKRRKFQQRELTPASQVEADPKRCPPEFGSTS